MPKKAKISDMVVHGPPPEAEEQQPPDQEPEGIDAEEHFYEDMDRSVTLSIGMKRQGKTYFMMKFLIRAIREQKFEEFHLVLPQFKTERDDKYKWLKFYDNVFIYNAYHQLVAERVLKEAQKKHIFFGIDDATSEFLTAKDASVQKLLTCNEHGAKCAVWICVHSCKKVLSPLMRQMLNYIFIYKNANAMLLKQCWEEFFSMEFDDFKEFKALYKEVVFDQDNEALMYSFDGNHAFGIKGFKMMSEEEPKPPKKVKKMPKDNYMEIDAQKENMKRSIFTQLARSKMKNQYQDPKEKKGHVTKMFSF
jgi:hypothetical protein